MIQHLFFMQRLFVISLLLVFTIFISGCGSSQEFVSNWSGQTIQIDGNSQDWQGSLQSFPKDNYSVGIRNDNKFLYLCFTTTDRDKIFKIVRSGMNVDFDSPSDPVKNYTIKFPIINPAVYMEAVGTFGPDVLQKESINFLFQEMLDKQAQFGLIQKDYANTILLKNKENIEVKAGTTNVLFVLELKVPLAATQSSFPIGAMPGEKINIKFETDPSRIDFREGTVAGQTMAGSAAAPASGSGGRGGRGGGGRGGNAGAAPSGDIGSGPVNLTEKFSIGFSVQLVKENQK